MHKFINEMKNGDRIVGIYAIKEISTKVTSKGDPYLDLVLMDKTGTINAKVWSYTGPLTSGDAGIAAQISGSVQEYNGSLQMRVEAIARAADGTYEVSDLIRVAPVDAGVIFNNIKSIINSIDDTEYRDVCQTMLERYGSIIKTLPAAKSVHHNFRSGLLMHTYNMLRIADHTATIYGDIIDRNLLLSGTFLHDLAKKDEFLVSELGTVTEYSLKGRLIGHLVMGYEEIERVCLELGVSEEKTVLLSHMILSHHGQPEFGAAVVPCVAEAELLSYIDLIDSRMEIYRECLETLENGQFSDKIFALGKAVYKKEAAE